MALKPRGNLNTVFCRVNLIMVNRAFFGQRRCRSEDTSSQHRADLAHIVAKIQLFGKTERFAAGLSLRSMDLNIHFIVISNGRDTVTCKSLSEEKNSGIAAADRLIVVQS